MFQVISCSKMAAQVLATTFTSQLARREKREKQKSLKAVLIGFLMMILRNFLMIICTHSINQNLVSWSI